MQLIHDSSFWKYFLKQFALREWTVHDSRWTFCSSYLKFSLKSKNLLKDLLKLLKFIKISNLFLSENYDFCVILNMNRRRYIYLRRWETWWSVLEWRDSRKLNIESNRFTRRGEISIICRSSFIKFIGIEWNAWWTVPMRTSVGTGYSSITVRNQRVRPWSPNTRRKILSRRSLIWWERGFLKF